MSETKAKYKDLDFRGLGIIKCGVCGEPLRDHALTSPCPLLVAQTGTRLVGPVRLPTRGGRPRSVAVREDQ